MAAGGEQLTIGGLAAAAGVSVDTVRFYERSGLLPEPPRDPSGYRRYDDRDVWRLGFVQRAKALGFTLREVGGLLEQVDVGADDDVVAAAVRSAATEKLAALARERQELEQTTERLEVLVGRCEGGDVLGCASLGDADGA